MTTQPLARCVAVIVLALIGSTGNTSAQRGSAVPLREWERVRSPHFTVVGDVSARELRRVAEQMEQFHELLGLVLERRDLRVPDTTVMVFKNRRDLRAVPADVSGHCGGGGWLFLAWTDELRDAGVEPGR